MTLHIKSAATVACFLVVACHPDEKSRTSSGQTLDDSIRQVLTQDLRRKIARSDVPDTLDESRVTFSAETSAVIPSLVYHWALFRSGRVTHGVASSVAGSRGDRLRLIDTPADWASLVGEWAASDSAAAGRACLELVKVTQDRLPTSRARYYSPSDPGEDYLNGDRSIMGQHLGAPLRVEKASAIWRVQGWVVDPGFTTLATKYECQVPASGAVPDSVRVRAVDSLVRPRPRR